MDSTLPATRLFQIVAVVTSIVVAGLLGGLIVIISNSAKLDATKMATDNNRRILEIIVAVTGCAADDTMDSCQAAQLTRNQIEGARRIAEVDCVTRRAVAGLPAPIPPGTCTAQTPPEVYPGTNQRSTP